MLTTTSNGPTINDSCGLYYPQGPNTPSSFSLSGITYSAAVATATLSTGTCAGDGIAAGKVITVSGANGASSALFNGQFAVKSITSNTFSYTISSTPTANSTAGSVVVNQANHPALAPASTKTTPGAVMAWEKVNIAGTLYYRPLYTSMTS